MSDTYAEDIAKIMSDAVHYNSWEKLKELSPLTAAAELRRAEALIRAGVQLI